MIDSSKSGIVVGASSDIGLALVNNFYSKKYNLVGTYRTKTDKHAALQKYCKHLSKCDLLDSASIDSFSDEIMELKFKWNFLIIAAGTLQPIGKFEECDFNEWMDGLQVNLQSQIQIIHSLLPLRSRDDPLFPIVVLFAGGGTNSAPRNFSSYTLSKIALIKAVELLDNEMSDVRFAIIGPGWVKTKIHEETIQAAQAAGSAFTETKERFLKNNFISMNNVVDCFNWALDTPKDVIGGRNISVSHDKWGEEDMAEALRNNIDMYKLRRSGNAWSSSS